MKKITLIIIVLISALLLTIGYISWLKYQSSKEPILPGKVMELESLKDDGNFGI